MWLTHKYSCLHLNDLLWRPAELCHISRRFNILPGVMRYVLPMCMAYVTPGSALHGFRVVRDLQHL